MEVLRQHDESEQFLGQRLGTPMQDQFAATRPTVEAIVHPAERPVAAVLVVEREIPDGSGKRDNIVEVAVKHRDDRLPGQLLPDHAEHQGPGLTLLCLELIPATFGRRAGRAERLHREASDRYRRELA